MTVLQLGPYPPPNGGVQTNLVAIRRHLARHGIRSGVINLARHREAREAEVYHPTSALQTLRLLLKLPYRTFHLHWGGSVTRRLLGLSLLLCWLPRRKAVLTFHSGGYPSSPEGGKANRRSLPGFVFRQFDRVIAVNEEIAGLMRRCGVRPERLRVICPTAIDPAETAGELPDSLAAFYRSHHPVLAAVGLLEPEYDLALPIGVLGHVRQRLPEAGLLIVGSGSLEGELRCRIQSTPWSEHILLAGDVPHGFTLRAIRDADMLLRTTLYDGDAVSVREGLHLGTPVIATDNGMRPPGVRLIPIGDAAALEAAICEVASAPRPLFGAEPVGLENVDAVLAVYRELETE